MDGIIKAQINGVAPPFNSPVSSDEWCYLSLAEQIIEDENTLSEINIVAFLELYGWTPGNCFCT